MFNKRIREARMIRGFTQQRLADMANIALRSYQCYETGTRTPNYALLIQLADILDVSIDWLLGRDEWLASHGVSSDVLR